MLLLGLGLLAAGPLGSPAAAGTAVKSTGNDVSAGTAQCSPDSDQGCPAGRFEDLRSGTTPVDRDLYQYHYGDINQFGDDESYNSASGHAGNGIRFPVHRER
jgi:hypothetical protein